MVPLHIHILGGFFLATCLVGSNIIGQYAYILTNNAKELTSYRFAFKCDTNKKIISVYAEIWNWISGMNNGHISQLCHTVGGLFILDG
jgi:hypothetical protein